MQEKLPTVSVIVPIFQVERYLQKCIDSIRRQTYEQLEIILIDDGSPDNCGYICEKNAAKDSRIVVIHKENEGLSCARNTGLNCAVGEYVVFVDSDDTIHPQFIEILLGLCEQYDCEIAQCDFLTVAEDSCKLPLNPQHSVKIYNNIQAIHQVCCGNSRVKFSIVWNKIYKKQIFEEIRYPIGKIHEDEFTTYQALWKIRRMADTNQYLYYYLQRTSSITKEPFSLKRLDILDAFRERMLFLKKRRLKEEYQCTLQTFSDLLEKNYILVKENLEDCENICSCLLEEKSRIERQLNGREKKNYPIDYAGVKNNCYIPAKAKIVLYGAGYWGHMYYRWIGEICGGEIVGWVDNFWYTFSGTQCPITPLDSLLHLEYDYILIAIKDKSIQEEVAGNLMSWGICKHKIIFMDLIYDMENKKV